MMRRQQSAPVLLVIGVHRDELAFGAKVAEGLDPNYFQVLRIEKGISGERPRHDQVKQFDQKHRDLYLQILQYLTPTTRLLIDLHQGLDCSKLRADVFSYNSFIPSNFNNLADVARDFKAEVYWYHLVEDTLLTNLETEEFPYDLVAKTPIPLEVWKYSRVPYIGLEIYTHNNGSGSTQEQQFARHLINRLSSMAFKVADIET